MQREVSVFISVVLMATAGLASRSCEDVQNTLITCIASADQSIMSQAGPPDNAALCRSTSELVGCVEEARRACPSLPLLSNPDFARAMEAMETLRETHCANPGLSTPSAPQQTTSGPMQGDQAESCDPLEAMNRCNDLMVNVQPGDIKAMCIPGDEFLACMSQIVDSCPAHAEVLPFDLQQAIDTTRVLLDQECPAVLGAHACAEKIEKAKQSCGDIMQDPLSDECGAMKTYMECMDITLMSCPDSELKMLLSKQYRQFCGEGSPDESNHGGGSECPDDLQSAVMSCSSDMEGVHPSDKDNYCRRAREALACVEDLTERCENDSRFDRIPSEMTDQMRQYINDLCPASGGQPLPEESNHGDGSECPDDLQSAMMTCTTDMQGVNPGDVDTYCRTSKEALACFEDLLGRCQNDPRSAMLPSDMIDQMRQHISDICPNGGQPLPEESNHGDGSECPDDLQSAMMTCTTDMQGVNPGDLDTYCRTSKETLACFEDLLGRCQNDPHSAMLPSDMIDQMRQHISDICPNGAQPLPDALECPEDVHSAIMRCTSHMDGADPSDMVVFCRNSRSLVACVDDLAERCENNARFAAVLPPGQIQQLHQHMSDFCPSDESRRPQPRARTRYPLRRLRQLLLP